MIPFLRPYRGLLFGALGALVATAIISLTLPLAVRRVVDNFYTKDPQTLDLYFAAALGIAGLLAIGTGLRYALVTRLGERVVADIRSMVYNHVIRQDPAFFETTKTGEVLSRLTTDTTLVQSISGVSLSIALRSTISFTGALTLLVFTSAALAGYMLLAIPIVVATKSMTPIDAATTGHPFPSFRLRPGSHDRSVTAQPTMPARLPASSDGMAIQGLGRRFTVDASAFRVRPGRPLRSRFVHRPGLADDAGRRRRVSFH